MWGYPRLSLSLSLMTVWYFWQFYRDWSPFSLNWLYIDTSILVWINFGMCRLEISACLVALPGVRGSKVSCQKKPEFLTDKFSDMKVFTSSIEPAIYKLQIFFAMATAPTTFEYQKRFILSFCNMCAFLYKACEGPRMFVFSNIENFGDINWIF